MFKKLPLLLVIALVILLAPTLYISWQTRGMIYRDVDMLPSHQVGLLLGTTPSVSGRVNLFYVTRIEAAKLLYEKGKIEHIIASGDNSTASYNEPEFMKRSLVSAGIPESVITLDYAGFRTLDSVVRAQKIFAQTGGIIIISQPFHLERALYLAKSRGIPAVGYGAANVSLEIAPRVYVREIFARWLAIVDTLFRKDPAVLGTVEPIFENQ